MITRGRKKNIKHLKKKRLKRIKISSQKARNERKEKLTEALKWNKKHKKFVTENLIIERPTKKGTQSALPFF